MGRLRYMKNARTGDAGTVCEGNLLINGKLEVTGTTNLDLTVTFDQSLLESFTVGESDTGYDVKFWGDDSSKYWLWDADNNRVNMVGDFAINGNIAVTGNITSVSGTLGVTGLATLGSASVTGALTVGTTTGLIGKLTISPDGTGTFFDFALETEWTGGTLINADFGGSDVTMTADIVGMKLDFATNVAAVTDLDITGYKILLPDLSQSDTLTTFIGFDLSAAGAIISTAGTFTWQGLHIIMPETTENGGTVNAYGVYIDASGTINSGTQDGICITGSITLTDGIKIASNCVDGIEISGDCTDGIEISGDCTNFINISHAADTAATGIKFADAFKGHSIMTGAYQSTDDGGVILDSTNTFNAGFLADDSGSDISASVRNVLARTLLTITQSGGSIRSLMGQLKLLTGVDVGNGVYTAVQGYIELAGTTSVTTGGKASCIDASLEIPNSATLTVDSGAIFAGVKIETTAADGGSATFTQDGTVAAVYIDTVGVTDWKVGVDVNDCTTGIDIDAATTGISISGASTGNAISITQTTNSATTGYVMAIGLTGAHLTTATPNAAPIKIYCDSTATSGDNRGIYNRLYFKANNATGGESLRSYTEVTPTYTIGTAHGAHLSLGMGESGTTGIVSGLGVAVRSTLGIPNTTLTGGTYASVMAEIYSFGSSSDASVTELSFIRIVNGGDSTGKDNIDDAAYLFVLDGFTAGDGSVLYGNTLKMKVDSTNYYLPMSTAQASFTTAYPIVASYAAGSATSKAILVNPSLAAPDMDDGYGFGIEVNATITGSAGGSKKCAAASSTWLNIDSVLQAGGYYCARTDGIYEGTATITDANLIFGARMQAQLSSSDFRRLCPFSLNSTEDISALFMIGVGDATVGIKKADSSGIDEQYGSLKMAIDQDGNVYYVKLYKNEAGS